MPIYTPSAETLDPAPFTAIGVGLPYDEIIASLGSFIYVVKKMRVVTSSFPQLTQSIIYTRKDANGNEISKPYALQVNKNITQPVDEIDVDMVFDGKSSLSYNLLSGESVNLFFSGKAYSITDYLQVGGDIDLLKQLEGEEI